MIKSDLKKRNWTFVLYEDSCAKDWEEYLVSTGVPFSYVYHDKDKTELGEPKKPHYHVLVCFDGPTTYNTIVSFSATRETIIEGGWVDTICYFSNFSPNSL